MTSVFFKISPYDYIEAAPLNISNNLYAVRIVSFKNNGYDYVILNNLTSHELVTLITILRGKIVPDVYYLNDLKNLIYIGY